MGEAGSKLRQKSYLTERMLYLSLSVSFILVKMEIDQSLLNNVVYLGPFI